MTIKEEYKQLYAKIKKIYVEQMREAKYWCKIETQYEKLSRGQDAFSMTFKHGGFWDNEAKIREITYKYGFLLSDQSIDGMTSTYFFKRKKMEENNL